MARGVPRPKVKREYPESPGQKARKKIDKAGRGIKAAVKHGLSYGTTSGQMKKAAGWLKRRGFVPSYK